jgi:hypothetical protein
MRRTPLISRKDSATLAGKGNVATRLRGDRKRGGSMRAKVGSMVGLQMAALAGCAMLMARSVRLVQRMIENQADLMRNQTAFPRTNKYIARGPDWMDHYGRRNRDVNVERV